MTKRPPAKPRAKSKAQSTAAAAKSAAARVAKYIAALPPDARRMMKRIRADIRATAPDAVEHFGYGIPGFRLDGRTLVYYAGWRDHVSMYPVGAALVRAHGADGSMKGTIRFALADPPPSSLVRKIVRARVTDVRRRGR